jgi:hypothetical protein
MNLLYFVFKNGYIGRATKAYIKFNIYAFFIVLLLAMAFTILAEILTN